MESNYVILHDEFLCIGCQSCTVACTNLHSINNPFARVQVQIHGPENGRYVLNRVSCRHCADAPCVSVCPTGATFRGDGGIVQIDDSKCIKCGYCVGACPYSVRYIDKSKAAVDKCDFCSKSRLPNGEKPACVSVCPTDALVFGKMDSDEVQNWLKNTSHIYQDEKPGTGKHQLYRRKEVHKEVAT